MAGKYGRFVRAPAILRNNSRATMSRGVHFGHASSIEPRFHGFYKK
jgi:hypothetical protein